MIIYTYFSIGNDFLPHLNGIDISNNSLMICYNYILAYFRLGKNII